MMLPTDRTCLVKHPSEDYYIAVVDGERGYFTLSEEVRHSKSFADDWNARMGHTEDYIWNVVAQSLRDE